jgi:hypothetical protein
MCPVHVLPGAHYDWVVKDGMGREISRHSKRKAAENIARIEAAKRGEELLIFNHFNELEYRSRPRRGLFGNMHAKPRAV